MHDIVKKYLKSDFGDIEVPIDDNEKVKLAKELFGLSIVEKLDYWLDIAKDKVNNKEPKETYQRDNEFSKKDKLLRDTFAKLDKPTKDILLQLINSTSTGIVFSILTNFDQFDFGKLTISLQPKSLKRTDIKISSGEDELHDELSEWIYSNSKFKDDLVEKSQDKYGVSFRLK